ncbi:MAG: TolC family protein [Bacteroidetes bacterium]|nr:TolC family protein [Bacteroidota bacterium]
MKYLRIFFLSAVLLVTSIAVSQDTLLVDLQESLIMAESNNRLIRIFEYKIDHARKKLSEMKSHFYPRVIFEGTFAYNSDPNIYVKKGEMNHVYDDLIDVGWIDELLKEYFPLPPKDITLLYGDNWFYKTNLGLYQPISQITTVNTGKKAAQADVRITETEKSNLVSEIRLGVIELYYGILLESKREEAASIELEYKKLQYQDARNAEKVGEILALDTEALNAELFEKEQELIQIRNRKESYMLTFRQLLGLDYNTVPIPATVAFLSKEMAPLDDYIHIASNGNYKLQISGLTLVKAGYGIDAAKKGYIPELIGFAQYNYNKGIPLMADDYLLAGLNLKWTLVAAGERAALRKQSNALYEEALEDLEYEKESVRNEVEKTYLDLIYAKKLLATAGKALEARQEEFRLAQNARKEGLILEYKLLEARADLAWAECDILGARLNYQILMARMDRLTGEDISHPE